MAVTAVAGAVCLAVAILAARTVRAEQTRPPTADELTAAAQLAVAQRWRTWPEGQIFPAKLRYTASQLASEKAARAGLAPGHACGAGLAGAMAAAARRAGCLAVLRATYLDPLQGVVYTVGVVAFGSPARAAAFARVAGRQSLPAGLRAFALAGTGAARFTEAARQRQAVRQAGPYVVATVAGYADGRRADGTASRQAPVFAPAGQLAAHVLQPLTALPAVRCGSQGWSC